MEKEETDKLAGAVMKVSAEYGSVAISPKTLAWVNLAMVCGALYGPRLAAFKVRKMAEAQEKPTTPQVQPFHVIG